MSARFVCVHGHFYQPPRENPWLEALERQESAWPAHDWNERVTDECYAPNAHARILDERGAIARIQNNYERLSFNFGPTLLSWMERANPEAYAAILAADRSHVARTGHGAAIAQVYNHMILPLADRRDKATQVIWGLRDFEHRFGRRAKGMWLAETAVCTESLEVLAEHGVRFTILAPHQCGRVRAPGGEWQGVHGQRVDPRRPYRATLPSGRTIDLLFYDGPISRAVAFERLLDDGHRFRSRLMGAFDGRDEPQLVHIATDGETYGHHHAYGEMALAVALQQFDDDPSVELVSYEELLARMPPTWEAEIIDDTSWSCAHGVERWRSDCGCNTGTGWHQRWRAPLREALDWLRDELRARWEPAAAALLDDPWAARDAYIEVLLDRSDDRMASFCDAHGVPVERREEALELLELQRHAMLMYTSCGWFFDEPSGLETVQVLRYAARAIQLAARRLGHDFGPAFQERLAAAPSNRETFGDVEGVYRELVLPSQVEIEDVGGHFAIASVFDDEDQRRLGGFEARFLEHDVARSGGNRLATGRLEVRSKITGESRDLTYAVLCFGGHNVVGGVRPFEHPARHMALQGALTSAFARADLSEVVRQIERQLPRERPLSLRSLFHDEQARILERLLEERTRAVEETFESVYDRIAPLMRFGLSLGQPPPESFRAAAHYTLLTRLRRAASAGEAFDVARLERLLDEAREAEIALDPVTLGVALQSTLEACAEAVERDPDDLAALLRLRDAAAFAARSPWRFEPSEVQTALWRFAHEQLPRWNGDAERTGALRDVLEHLGVRAPTA